MKNIKFLFLLVLVAFSSCDDDDNSNENTTNIIVPNLIEIETQPSHVVSDILYLKSNFSRFLTQQGQTSSTDIFAITNAPSFSFSFGLEKKNIDGTWSIINLENKMIGDRGNINDGYYNIADCVYNSSTEIYEFRAGIPLEQAGDYRIFFGFTDASRLELSSNDVSANSNHLNIQTSVINMNDFYYFFTVQ